MIYVDQPAITLTLSGSAGTYFIAISRDVSTAYATWTRRPGSHYLWQLAGSLPPDIDGVLVFAGAVVSGGIITAAGPIPGVTRAERWRTLAGLDALGTMAAQNADAVAITGGTATLSAATLGTLGVSGAATITGTLNGATGTFTENVQAKQFVIPDTAGTPMTGVNGTLSAGTNRWNLFMQGTAQNLLTGKTGLGGSPSAIGQVTVAYDKATIHGLIVQPLNTDVSGQTALLFMNMGGTPVGSIHTTAAATAYNTTSDVRLKAFVQTLVGALDVIRALNPVSFHWQADGSKGNGFLAHELMKTIPEAVSGLPDEVNLDGTIKPQQVDHSKLVVFLVGAVQELLKRVEVLEELVTAP